MKNNYNPYTVPENFFENVSERSIARYRNRRRAIRYSIVATVLAAVLIVTPLFVNTRECRIQETEIVSSNLAGLYEYDVFLQVNFTE